MNEQGNRIAPGLRLIASSGQIAESVTLLDFTPYVASINGAGQVAFQATCQRGARADSGIFCGDGNSLREMRVVDDPAPVPQTEGQGPSQWQFVSHPAINDAGDISVYAESKAQGKALLIWRGQRWEVLAGVESGLKQIGPLGPTMNAAGAVGFRAQDAAGLHGIYLASLEACHLLADARHGFSAFHGLPVVNARGDVLFRADQSGGRQTLCWCPGRGGESAPGPCQVLVDNAGEFAELSLFPTMNDAGRVIFAATRKAGGAGIYCIDAALDRTPVLLFDSGQVFQSLRGALINQVGPLAFFATPHGGDLGIYHFAPASEEAPLPLLALGDALLDSHVVGFALNPVSCNALGQLAIRVALADGRALIVCADPPPQG